MRGRTETKVFTQRLLCTHSSSESFERGRWCSKAPGFHFPDVVNRADVFIVCVVSDAFAAECLNIEMPPDRKSVV